MTTEGGTVHFDLAGEPYLAGLCGNCLAQLVHQHEGGLVLHGQVARELHCRKPFEAFTNRQIARADRRRRACARRRSCLT